jgi:hypothetical protein
MAWFLAAADTCARIHGGISGRARAAYFARLRGSLRPGGRVTIIDFLPDAPAGPPRQARIPAALVKDEMERAGYGLITEHTFLPYQYFLIFAPR